MNDTVQLVAQKNHDDNIEKLDIPEKVIPYLNINVIQLIADRISKLTQQTFTYYGNLTKSEDATVITIKSREGNEVDISITHDLEFEDKPDQSGENIVFDGLTKLLNKNIDLLDDYVENSDEPDAISQQHKISKDKLEKILSNIGTFTEQQKEDHQKKKQEDAILKRKQIIMEKLGIENEQEEEEKEPEITSERAQALSNILDGIEEEVKKEVEEVEQTKEDNSKKVEGMNTFLDALSNINKNDLAKTKQQVQLNRVKKHLDSLNGNT